MNDDADSKGGVQALETGLSLLMAFTRLKGPQQLKTLAEASRMPAAKAHRYLVSLSRAGLVRQESEGSRYSLGLGALQIGLAAMSELDVIELGLAKLPDIRDDLCETVGLVIWSAEGPTYVRVLESNRPVSVNSKTGSVLPLLYSASGRVFLAYLPPRDTAELARKELRLGENPGGGAALTAGEVEEVVRRTREVGLGIVRSGYFPGIAALSAPIMDFHGDLVAALTVLGPDSALDVSADGELATRLKAHALQLSLALGYQIDTR
ncbi:IclR family transcriptional regulator [Paraburkholderia agricolaris]|uniref:IclR family transcriptional regulator n=1 Tax=Paraburkholderia agricolaris TaxID=2152888 RepID=A0ABW9A200_9BURK